MNVQNIIVRVDAEHRTAELEIKSHQRNPERDELDVALTEVGVRPLYAVEWVSSRFYVMRIKLAMRDGSPFDPCRVMEVVRAARFPAAVGVERLLEVSRDCHTRMRPERHGAAPSWSPMSRTVDSWRTLKSNSGRPKIQRCSSSD